MTIGVPILYRLVKNFHIFFLFWLPPKKICVWISVFRRKMQFVNPLHSSKFTTILLIEKNSGIFFKHPVSARYLIWAPYTLDIRAGFMWWYYIINCLLWLSPINGRGEKKMIWLISLTLCYHEYSLQGTKRSDEYHYWFNLLSCFISLENISPKVYLIMQSANTYRQFVNEFI